MNDQIDTAERTRIVYGYFTLDEWKLLNRALNTLLVTAPATEVSTREVMAILEKMPSASFDGNTEPRSPSC